MPKQIHAMQAVQVGRLSAGRHSVGGVPNLQLLVKPNGSRYWVMRVRVGGIRRDMGLGRFPVVSLAAARDLARAVYLKVLQGIDPVEQRMAARDAARKVPTFAWCAERKLAAKAPEWKKGSKSAAQFTSSLETYAFPVLGTLPVDKVELRHVLDVLTPIWETKTETANRVRGRIESVLDWATVSGYRRGDNPARLRGNLDAVLPAAGKVKKVQHHAALPVADMHEFVNALRKRDGMAARALEFAILTAARSGEVRGATWVEIDLDAATWTVPAERMKARKPHRVPLCARAVALLRALPRMAGNDFVFWAVRGGELSDMSISAVCRRMKVAAVPHGFRSTFRDWAAERTSYPREVAEMALAHTIGNKVEAAYRRGDLYAKRTHMMDDWSKFIDTAPETGNVVTLRKGAKA